MSKVPREHSVPNTSFVVDSFKNRNLRIFFLSHYHSDHTGGLSVRFFRDNPSSSIYCSLITARLLHRVSRVPVSSIRPMRLNEAVDVIDSSHGEKSVVRVTCIDANHCPGAVMFLFEMPTGERYLHTGDFRFHLESIEHTPLVHEGTPVKLTELFLDTTFCKQRYRYPSQDVMCERVATEVRDALRAAAENEKSLSVQVGTYSLGKEKVLAAIARLCQCKIHVEAEKMRMFRCFVSSCPPAPFEEEIAEWKEELAEWPLATDLVSGDSRIVGESLAQSETNCGCTTRSLSPASLCSVTPFPLEIFTDEDASESASVHGCRMGELTHKRLLHASESSTVPILAFSCTGWAGNAPRSRKVGENVTLWSVPYSEHCNFDELIEFVSFFRPYKLIPTVFNDARDKKRLVGIFEEHVDNSLNRGKIHRYFQGGKMSEEEPAANLGYSDTEEAVTMHLADPPVSPLSQLEGDNAVETCPEPVQNEPQRDRTARTVVTRSVGKFENQGKDGSSPSSAQVSRSPRKRRRSRSSSESVRFSLAEDFSTPRSRRIDVQETVASHVEDAEEVVFVEERRNSSAAARIYDHLKKVTSRQRRSFKFRKTM